MQQRFSSDELHELRNAIPMETVIRDVLNLPNKVVEGVFRFLCPLCGEFETGVHKKTNLSRCFRCMHNFNAIELVMEDKKLDFVKSVKFLKNYLAS